MLSSACATCQGNRSHIRVNAYLCLQFTGKMADDQVTQQKYDVLGHSVGAFPYHAAFVQQTA